MKEIIVTIEKFDLQGQGIGYFNNQVIFIPKSAPGDVLSIYPPHKKKGVYFGKIKKIITPSAFRIKEECPHFQECSGCDYFHLSYEKEISIKKETLKNHLKKLKQNDFPIELYPSDQSTFYRNRIQLHYHLKQDKMGFHNNRSHEITEVPSCIIASPSITTSLKNLYLQQKWKKILPPQAPQKGHLEIQSLSPQKTQVIINQNYAHGGFTQVNEQVNHKINLYTKKLFAPYQNAPHFFIDLFSGTGNHSQSIAKKQKILLDCTEQELPQYYQTNLYTFTSKEISNLHQKIQTNANYHLIVNPPRSGFKNISEWVQEFSPLTITYLSCHPATCMRDLTTLLSRYQVKQVALFDLFPRTKHFETLIHLQKH